MVVMMEVERMGTEHGVFRQKMRDILVNTRCTVERWRKVVRTMTGTRKMIDGGIRTVLEV